MRFSAIVITRPRAEAIELAETLDAMQVPQSSAGSKCIILPAFEFRARGLPAEAIRQVQQAAAKRRILLIFTSPRSVDFGLGQFPPTVLKNASVAAIGPATAECLTQAGVAPELVSRRGYTSEDLLHEIQLHHGSGSAGDPTHHTQAFIVAAPGGRDALQEGLATIGIEPHMLMVYERQPAKLEPAVLDAIPRTGSLLVVWTSENAITDLQRRLPPAIWSHLLGAEWLVISDRLADIAQNWQPARVHRATGPSNAAIVQAVRLLD